MLDKLYKQIKGKEKNSISHERKKVYKTKIIGFIIFIILAILTFIFMR